MSYKVLLYRDPETKLVDIELLNQRGVLMKRIRITQEEFEELKKQIAELK